MCFEMKNNHYHTLKHPHTKHVIFLKFFLMVNKRKETLFHLRVNS